MLAQKIIFTLARCVMAATLLAVASAQEPDRPTPGTAEPQIAAALREVSAVRIQHTIATLVGFYTRQTLSSDLPPLSNHGINAAADWIQNEFQQYSSQCGDCLQVRTEAFIQQPGPRIPQPTRITDVYAILRGTDPANAGRIYLVTGHYDSRNSDTNDAVGAAPGANDDASGTAVSLECARVLSQHRFPATIIFLTVAGEEQGLYGSAQFARMSKSVGWDIGAVLNNDIVGGDRTPNYSGQNTHIVRVFSEGIPATASPEEIQRLRATGGESDSPSRQLARYVAAVAEEYFPASTTQDAQSASAATVSKPEVAGQGFRAMLVFRPDRYLRGGDHFSFNDQGYPAVRLTEYRENFDHQHQNVRSDNGVEYGDLQKFVDQDYVANVVRLNAATLASLAFAPAPPANVRLLTKELQNRSTLHWDPTPGGLGTGYEVLWRDTTAPDWQHVAAVANATQVTLPVSKDNVIFAVRAVDAKGHRSLAVVPQPER